MLSLGLLEGATHMMLQQGTPNLLVTISSASALVSSLGTLLAWGTISSIAATFVHNSIAFARLGRDHIRVDLLDPQCTYGQELAALLNLRGYLEKCSEWPFKVSSLLRWSLYLLIPPLTWVGAALIENVVDAAIH